MIEQYEGETDQRGEAGGDIKAIDGKRWWRTATDGSGLRQGDSTTLTWSVVPDGTYLGSGAGESATPSNLQAHLDSLYGTITNWLPVLEQAFHNWAEVTGINFVYEATDDGANFSGSNSGQPGIRGDIRLGGHAIDGNGKILAYNYYPDFGDMILDTGDSFYSDLSNNSLRLRNTVAHEIGHGLGLGHTLPRSGTKLMEPSISLAFDGPQPDDVLRSNRGYGDRLESNDTPATAYDIGTLGTSPTNISGVSIDDDSDIDYFRFTVGSNIDIDINLTPLGSVYTVGVDGGTSESIDTRRLSDLGLTLLNATNNSIIATADASGLGGSEVLAGINVSAGQYLVRVAGAEDTAQMYELQVNATGDGDGDDETLPQQPPVLNPIGERSLPAGVASQLTLSASDPDGDPLTFTASAQSVEYHLDQSMGLNSVGGSEYYNWSGQQEKWLTSASGTWYYIKPNGQFYRWNGGSVANDTLIETVSPAAHTDTALLYDAQPDAAPATLSLSGSILTITPDQDFDGSFFVSVSVQDGRGGVDSETVRVNITTSTPSDTTAPSVISRTPAQGATVTSSSITMELTFSEQVVGVDTSDLQLSGTGAAQAVIGSPINSSGNTWRYAISGLSDGEVQVALAESGSGIQDLAGNPLAASQWSFNVQLSEDQQPPVLNPIGDLTTVAGQTLRMPLSASDPNGDSLTFTVSGQSEAYMLDQQFKLDSSGGDEYFNWGGKNEKWFVGGGGAWFYITPDGGFYRWQGGDLSSDTRLADLGSSHWENTALVHSPQANHPPAVLTINGSELVIQPESDFQGTFYVTVTVSDGHGGQDSQSFTVRVG